MSQGSSERPFGARARQAGVAAGALLLVAGVLFIRLASPVAALLESRPGLRRLVVHPWNESDFVLRRLSETFPFGFAVVLFGVLLLLLSIPRGSPAAVRLPGPPPLRLGFADGAVLAGASLAALTLFAFLARRGLLTGHGAPWLFVALLASATASLAWRDRREGRRFGVPLTPLEAAGLVLGSAAALALFASGANDWRFSYIGDEWDHFTRARELAGGRLGDVPWLALEGVAEFWPVAVTGWQAVVLRLFGETNLAWRLSMALLLAACLPPLYLTIRRLLEAVSPRPRLGAAFGCALFACSEQIVVWARIGKPHAAFVPPVVFAAAAYLAARRRRSRTLWFATGMLSGLGLLLSPFGPVLALGTVGGWLLLDAITSPRGGRDLRAEFLLPGLLIAAGFMVAAAPFAVQTDYWKNQWLVNLTSEEAASNRHLLLPRTIQSFVLFLSWKADGHFLWRNAIDPVTAVFTAAGFGAVRFVGTRYGARLLWSFVVIAFLTGGIAKYGAPPPSRMMVLVFPVALLAAAGFSALTARAGRGAFAVAALAVPAIGFANLWKLENFNPYFPNRDWQMIEMQRFAEAPPGTRHLLILPRDQHAPLRGLLEAYGLGDRAVLVEAGPGSETVVARLLRRGGTPVEVRAMDPADADAARAAAERAGARIGPLIVGGVPARGAGVDPSLFALFRALND